MTSGFHKTHLDYWFISFLKKKSYFHKNRSQSSKKGKLFWICSMSSTKLRSGDHRWADQRKKLYYLVTVRLTFDYLYLLKYDFFLFFQNSG